MWEFKYSCFLDIMDYTFASLNGWRAIGHRNTIMRWANIALCSRCVDFRVLGRARTSARKLARLCNYPCRYFSDVPYNPTKFVCHLSNSERAHVFEGERRWPCVRACVCMVRACIGAFVCIQHHNNHSCMHAWWTRAIHQRQLKPSISIALHQNHANHFFSC